jgi:hypothetical protein
MVVPEYIVSIITNIVLAGILGWMVKLTYTVFGVQAKQSAQDALDKGIDQKIATLEKKIDETKGDFHDSMNRLEGRFNVFDSKIDRMFEMIHNSTK